MEKTFVLLFSLDFGTPRNFAEEIENTDFVFDLKKQINEKEIRERVIKNLKIEKEVEEGCIVKVFELTDFMDAFNDEEIEQSLYFMSYVKAKVKGN